MQFLLLPLPLLLLLLLIRLLLLALLLLFLCSASVHFSHVQQFSHLALRSCQFATQLTDLLLAQPRRVQSVGEVRVQL